MCVLFKKMLKPISIHAALDELLLVILSAFRILNKLGIYYSKGFINRFHLMLIKIL